MKTAKVKIPRGRKSELVVSCQVVINPFCGLSVIFCGFISHLIGRETINIPEIYSGVHGFTGKTVNECLSMNKNGELISLYLPLCSSCSNGHAEQLSFFEGRVAVAIFVDY